MTILYLHGFRSSPLSFKARLLAARMRQLGLQEQWLCPQLPAEPRQAIQLALDLAQGCAARDLALIGSSLGGYYATWLAERLGCKAVLLNPAVAAARDLATQVGVSTDYHTGAPFEFLPGYVDQLRELAVPAITRPERYFLLAATGDEVLDWREMVAHYPGARQHVVHGSDHGLSDFPDHMDAVLEFCGVDTARCPT